MAAGGKNYFPELTGIRALMMYGIYNCHFNLIDPAIWGNTLYRLGQELHLGVPIFYVLSGFLIYFRYGHDLKHISLPWALHYAKNRAARIYPFYFILLTFTYLWAGFPDSARETIITYTLTQALFPDLVHAGIAQTWTLTIEETFYFSAPLIFLAALRWGLFVPCLGIFLLGIFLVTVDVPFNPYYGNPSHVFGRTLCGMIACFGFGILLGKIVRRRAGNLPRRARPILTYGALAGMLVVMLALTQLAEIAEASRPGADLVRGSEHPAGFFLSYCVFPGFVSVLFWGMMTEPSAFKRFLGFPLVVLLGRSSYCFYLLHFGVVSDLFERYITDSRLGQILLLSLLSVLTFKLIEHPANQYIKHLGRPPREVGDSFAATLNRRTLAYVGLFGAILIVQLVPLSLVTQHRADIAYTLLAEGGWLYAMELALLSAAGVIFASVLFLLPSDVAKSVSDKGRKIALLTLAALAFLAVGVESDWGRPIFEGSTPLPAALGEMASSDPTSAVAAVERADAIDWLRVLWMTGMCVYVVGGALVTAYFPRIRAHVQRWGIPLASPQLGIVLGASLLWYLGVDRSADIFGPVLGLVMVTFAVEVLFESGFERSARPYFGTYVAACVTALSVFVVTIATGHPADTPRVQAARLAHEAEELFAKGDSNAAIEAAKASVALWPRDADAQFTLGLAYLQRGQIEPAVVALSRAIDLDANMSEAHNKLGEIRVRQDRLNDAGVHFQDAIRVNQHNADAHNNLGVLLEMVGEIEQARVEYEIALRIEPHFKKARHNLSRLKVRLEDGP